MPTSFPMNGGDGPYSYSNNSQLARDLLNGSKEMVRDAIIQKLDIKTMLSSSSNTLSIAEFGCSVGPNTLIAMQNIIEALKDKYLNQLITNDTNNILEFQVFFNDHVTNDFNTLFQSLPIDHRSYYAFGVPGSFYDRLFPPRSIHFAHSSCSIHWLSKVPEELLDEKSPAWNKGSIHYLSGSNIEVVNAYVAQFENDMDMFFDARAEEIVPGGMMVLVTPFSSYTPLLGFFGSSLMDLVNEREAFDGAKEMVREAIIQNLDIKSILSSSSNTLSIAELGCSVGPNTLIAMQHVIEALKDKYLNQVITNNNILEIQIFFDDHVTNDFNTLFRSLPIDRSYYAYGVPGSFHDRLFPSRSIHFAHSCNSIHWLSKCPEELFDEKSPAWNKGLIHYMSESKIEVVNAYVAQFEKDMEMFFDARAEEIVPGGMMILVTPFGSYLPMMEFFGSSFMDLVNEGKLDESLVDSFNLPIYFPTPEDMTKVVEKNGCFSIERMELTYPKSRLVDEADAKAIMINLRAILEGAFINHFGSKIAEEACTRTILKSNELSAWMKVNCKKLCQLFVALKRK